MPRHTLQPILLVASMFAGGTVGYRYIEGASWWDSFYMTVITLTTVGYGEEFPLSEWGEAFTALLLLSGVGVFLFVLTEIGRTVLEGELQEFWGQRRRSRMIDQMSGHQIVCGFGRMGRAVVDELKRSGERIVVIDRVPERFERVRDGALPSVVGDATAEATLIQAGIGRARGMVACLKDDAQNVYAVLTARAINPDLFIVARATEDEAEERVRQAGADRAVNPYQISGLRLAHLLVKPTIVGFFDASLGRSGEELLLEERALTPAHPLAGKSLAEADLRGRYGLGVVAIQRGEEFIVDPPVETSFERGDVIVLLGTREQMARLDAG
ncbi:MAG: potassium channel protein, partial [Vicinamibacterales bacterium]|nr:potassium channel protein [Vicinamibacterales bacterium]